jgi:hypothetical protein
MSLFSGSTKTKSSGTQSPTNPVPVTNSIIDFTKLIGSLGTQNPQQYVSGPSNLQNAAFSMGAGIANRYGIGVPQGQPQVGKPQINRVPTNANTPEGQMSVQMGKPQYSSNTAASMFDSPGINTPVQVNNGGGGLYGAAGITQATSDPNYLNGWTPPADVRAEWQRLQGRMGNPSERSIYNNMFDLNGDQSVTEREYYNWWIQNHGTPEGRANLPSPTGAPAGGGQGGQDGGQGGGMTPSGGNSYIPQSGVGYTAANMGANPMDLYRDASNMTRNAGMAGPNLAQMAGLGPANTYNASGQAQTGSYNPAGMAGAQGYNAATAGSQGYSASGPAGTQGYQASGQTAGRGYQASAQTGAQGYGVTDAQASGYDAANAGSQGYTAAGAANVGGYEAGRATAGGYNAQNAGSRGYAADTISDAQRVQIAAAQNANASRGIEFSQPYENRYTDNVVNSTLSNFDEYAGRQRAAEAAQAAGNNAFGGSRFGVQRAITEEQIARERASQESGLRFGAQDRAFGLGMQDAGMATQTSQFNAQQANQQAQAQAGMDLNRLLANMDARNTAGAFGASAANQASQFNAGSANTARQFGANAQNAASMFNTEAQNAASQFGASARNQAALDAVGRQDVASQFGANAGNTAALTNAAAQNQSRMFGADAGNQASQFNAGSRNQAGQFGADATNRSALDFAGRNDAAGQFGADALNRSALDFAGRSDAAGQFGADAANRSALDYMGRMDQAGQFGANAANTAGMYNAGSQNQASQFGADAFNRAGLDFAGRSDAAGALGASARNAASMDAAGRMDQAGQFNAGSQNQFDLSRFGASNDMARFNAGQGDTALNRQLAAGGQLGDLAGAMGNNERADLQMLSALGADERNISQQQATADLQLMQMMAQLYGTMPYGLFNGQNNTQTQTATSNPSILSTLGSAAMGLGSLGWNPFGGKP